MAFLTDLATTVQWFGDAHLQLVLESRRDTSKTNAIEEGARKKRREMQDFSAFLDYFTEKEWAAMTNQMVDTHTKGDIVHNKLFSLGGRCLDEPTMHLATTLELAISEPEDKLDRMSAESMKQMLRYFKRTRSARLNREKKHNSNRAPIPYVVCLPLNPDVLKREYPDIWAAAFPNPGDVPIACVISKLRLRNIDARYPCRGDAAKHVEKVSKPCPTIDAVGNMDGMHSFATAMVSAMNNMAESQRKMFDMVTQVPGPAVGSSYHAQAKRLEDLVGPGVRRLPTMVLQDISPSPQGAPGGFLQPPAGGSPSAGGGGATAAVGAAADIAAEIALVLPPPAAVGAAAEMQELPPHATGASEAMVDGEPTTPRLALIGSTQATAGPGLTALVASAPAQPPCPSRIMSMLDALQQREEAKKQVAKQKAVEQRVHVKLAKQTASEDWNMKQLENGAAAAAPIVRMRINKKTTEVVGAAPIMGREAPLAGPLQVARVSISAGPDGRVKPEGATELIGGKGMPFFNIEGTRSNVQCRTGWKGVGQSFAFKWGPDRVHKTVESAKRAAEQWVSDERKRQRIE